MTTWKPLKVIAEWTGQPVNRIRWWARSLQIASACRVADRVIVVDMIDVAKRIAMQRTQSTVAPFDNDVSVPHPHR